MDHAPLLKTALAAVIVGLGVSVWLRPSQGPTNMSSPAPTACVQMSVPALREDAAGRVATYRPERLGDLAAPDAPIREILAGLPYVASVTRAVAVEAPRQTIVHLKNWHVVSKNLFAADLRETEGPLSESQIEALYAEHLKLVERVQIEQIAVLRCLIRHHGLTRVYLEGLTATDRPLFEAKIKVLRAIEAEVLGLQLEISNATKEMEMLAVAGLSDSDDYAEWKEIRSRLAVPIEEHRRDLLQIGAPGYCYMIGDLESVVPLDELGHFKAAHPLREGGRIVLDSATNEAREDAQVKILLAGERVEVALLGGAHDLANNIQKLGGGEIELLTVTTSGYREAAGE